MLPGGKVNRSVAPTQPGPRSRKVQLLMSRQLTPEQE
jgi:hypothetical protein